MCLKPEKQRWKAGFCLPATNSIIPVSKTQFLKFSQNLRRKRIHTFLSRHPCHVCLPCKRTAADDFWADFYCSSVVRHSCGIGVAPGCIPRSVTCCEGLQGCASDSRLIYVFSIIFPCGRSCQVCTALFSCKAHKLSGISLHPDFTHCSKCSQLKGLLLSACLGNPFQDPGYGAFPQAAEVPRSAYFTFLCSDRMNLVIPISVVLL